MSCRQTQHVVLRCGVRFRHGSLFRHRASGCVNSSSATRALCGIGIAPYVATFLVNILNLPQSRFLFGEFGEVWTYLVSLEKASTNTPDQPGVCYHVNLKTLVQTRMGDMNGNDSDRRCSIWFPNKVHRSSWNKYAECRRTVFSCAQTCQSKGNAVYAVGVNLWISIDL